MRFQDVTDDFAYKGVAIYSWASQFLLVQASQSVGDRSSLVADSHPLFTSDETRLSETMQMFKSSIGVTM